MPTRSLAEMMSDAARELEGQVDPQETYESAVALASREIGGCDAAALTIVARRKKLTSPATSHPDAGAVSLALCAQTAGRLLSGAGGPSAEAPRPSGLQPD